MLSHAFFQDPAATEIYTLSLHDALPICGRLVRVGRQVRVLGQVGRRVEVAFLAGQVADRLGAHGDSSSGLSCIVAQVRMLDRKSTRLNSSHGYISYAVFCLKKKKKSIHG